MLIIDTKWKRISSRIDDQKQGISQGDVYQLMAYSRLYSCPNVILLYPHHAGLPDTSVHMNYAIGAPDAVEALTVATINLTRMRANQLDQLRQLISRCMGHPALDETLEGAMSVFA